MELAWLGKVIFKENTPLCFNELRYEKNLFKNSYSAK